MIEVYTTPAFDKLFKNLPPHIQVKASQKTEIFCENPYHPSLRIEKLHPRNLNAWSFRIDIHYRIVFEFINSNKAVFKFVGHHNNIYRVI